MHFLTLLEILNYGLVLVFGFLLSVHFAGSCETRRQKLIILTLCPVLLFVQGLCWFIWGTAIVRQLYPLLVHIPLVLMLILVLKKRVGTALVSVCTAYLCCQLPRWVKLAAVALTDSLLIGEISYTAVIFPIYFLLRRYFVRVAHDAMSYSSQTLFLFGSLPFFYYLFDYTTVIYSNALYSGVPALTEFFPTVLIIFYVAFLVAYHAQTQNRTQAELQRSMLEVELRQSATELESLRHIETQTAIYQHNMRHHLTAIDGFLTAGKPQQAEEYIKHVQTDVEAITPKHFCENELANLLCSSFANKAEHLDIKLTINAKLPQKLPISDTELCSVLSNGLENAFNAVSESEDSLKWTELYCDIRASKLLIEIKNPYTSEIIMRNGVPASYREGHGYGCRSIRSIIEQNGGICTFDAENGIFTLRIVLPASTKPVRRYSSQK